MTEPRFDVMQRVGPTGASGLDEWEYGIVLERRWQETGINNVTGVSHEPRWIYKIQTGPGGDLYEI